MMPNKEGRPFFRKPKTVRAKRMETVPVPAIAGLNGGRQIAPPRADERAFKRKMRAGDIRPSKPREPIDHAALKGDQDGHDPNRRPRGLSSHRPRNSIWPQHKIDRRDRA